MELLDYEERFFWKKIYHAAIKAGRSAVTAKDCSDWAVQDLRNTPVAKSTKTR